MTHVQRTTFQIEYISQEISCFVKIPITQKKINDQNELIPILLNCSEHHTRLVMGHVMQSKGDCGIDSDVVMEELSMDMQFPFHGELSWADPC